MCARARAPQTKRNAPPVIFLKDLRRRRGKGGGIRSLLGAGIPRTREEGRGRSSAGRNPSSLFCANSSRLRRGSPPEGSCASRPGIFSFRLLIISQKYRTSSPSPSPRLLRVPLSDFFQSGGEEEGVKSIAGRILDEGER